MRKSFISGFVTAAMLSAVITGCGSASAPAPTTAAAKTETSAGAESGSSSASREAQSIEQVWKSGSTVYVDVPAKAGGGTDLYTRYLTAALTEVCPGVNFVVTNYDTSEVGMQHTKNAAPDGLSLVTCHGGAIIQYLSGSSEVNIKDDLKVCGIMNQGGPQAIIANADAPYKNFKELSEYIKTHQGEVVVGCSLGGTTQVLFTSLIDTLTDGHPEYVNYVQCSSEADKLTNVAAGSINIANCSIPNAQAYDADGKLTVLGTLGPKASNIESMSKLTGMELDAKFTSTVEQGIDITWDSNYYVLAPAGTPDEVCAAINSALVKASEVQSFIDGNNQMATFIAPVDYENSKKALEAEWAFQDELVSSMGLKVR